MRKDLAHRILFNQLAVADHGNAITDAFDDIHFVGNQQNRQAQTTVDILQQLQNRARGSRIQGAGGFVAEQDFWVARQRTGDGDALFLTAGEVCRIAIVLIPQADEIEQLGNPAFDFFLRGIVEIQRQRHITEYGT